MKYTGDVGLSIHINQKFSPKACSVVTHQSINDTHCCYTSDRVGTIVSARNYHWVFFILEGTYMGEQDISTAHLSSDALWVPYLNVMKFGSCKSLNPSDISLCLVH